MYSLSSKRSIKEEVLEIIFQNSTLFRFCYILMAGVMPMIERTEYLEKLKRFKDMDLIKIIT